MITYSTFDSQFGPGLVASTDKGLCFAGFGKKADLLKDLKSRWKDSEFQEQSQTVHKSFESWLKDPSKTFSTPLDLKGTLFQRQVWVALQSIPSGKTLSYSELAKSVGKPKAVRAVGTAVGKNPISYLIPCHRVLRADGAIGGYHWGVQRKQQMLAWEKTD